MTDELPALPYAAAEATMDLYADHQGPVEAMQFLPEDTLLFTADQMRAYAAAAVAAERAKWLADAERLDYITSNARCDPKMDGQHVWWPTSFNHRLTGPTLRDAIDAARKA